MTTALLMRYVANFTRIGVLLFIGIPLVRWGSNMCAAFCAQRFSRHVGVLVGRIVFYSGFLFIVVTILHECGFNITALVGAAGIFGVAIGFASQTSISNIISGFFLIVEHSFSIGDTIKSGDIIGIVESVDLLAVTVRTPDNKLVRVPNEMVLKQHLTNLTYYTIKRIDYVISVPYLEDVESVKSQIYEVIKNNHICLREPAPMVMMNKIDQLDYDTEMRVFFTIRVWVSKDNFAIAPGFFMQQLKDQFDKSKRVITIIHVN